jgi:opacity protein-like surface antigen
MKRNLFWVIAFLCLMMVPQAYAAGYYSTGNVNLLIGKKSMDSDWDPVDNHTAIGVLFDYRERNWPISLAGEIIGSSDEQSYNNGDVKGSTTEFCIGIKKIWDIRNFPLKPYVAGGVGFFSAEWDEDFSSYSYSDDDSGIGFWLEGGIYATLSQHFNLGLIFRVSRADISMRDVFNNEVSDAGGDMFGLILGYHW